MEGIMPKFADGAVVLPKLDTLSLSEHTVKRLTFGDGNEWPEALALQMWLDRAYRNRLPQFNHVCTNKCQKVRPWYSSGCDYSADPEVSEESKKLINSFATWLGSNVGRGFMHEYLDKMDQISRNLREAKKISA